MHDSADDSRRQLRQGVYLLLIAVALGNTAGRIMAVNSVDKIRLESHLKGEFDKGKRKDWKQQRPFLSSNDRSRWATARALVEHGTYAIDEIIAEPNWDTIDMVKHRGRDGEPHLYSSKPALFPTMMAAEYWLIHKVTGKTLGEHPYEIGRFMLFTINGVALLIYFLMLAKTVERLGTTDWGRIFVMAVGTFGTFLSTFSVVINNHLIAAASVAVAVYATVRILCDGERRLRYFALAGLFAAFAAANELPAVSFFGLTGLILLFRAPLQTLIAGVPAAAVVAAAFFGAEYAAHGTINPPYSKRAEGKDWETGNWYNYTYERGGRQITSYWADKPKQAKVDQGEKSPADYALHALIGHHGIFSLTPIWLAIFPGLWGWWRRDGGCWRMLPLGIFLLTAICLTFYLARPMNDRNYGGTTSGFRWVFWFAPLWLVAMLPAADSASTCRWKRGLLCLLLAFSVLSVSFPTWNPWTHPWLVNFFVHLGWLDW